MTAHSLYDDVVTITYDYLGPAADRFVIRQIRNHLQKDPGKLERQDLKRLIDWIQLAMRLITEDREVVDRYVADLQTLTQRKRSMPQDGKAKR